MTSLSKTTSFSSPASDGDAADLRLREAEDRLREAMEELERRQRHIHPPCDHADDSCVVNAIGNLCQSFLLSYGVRVGIGQPVRSGHCFTNRSDLGHCFTNRSDPADEEMKKKKATERRMRKRVDYLNKN